MRQLLPTILLLGILVSCHSRAASTRSAPESCSPPMPVPGKLIGIRRALATDTALMRTGEAGLFVVVDEGRHNGRLAGAAAYISGTSIGARTNDSGQALLSRMHKSPVSLVVRGLGYTTWQSDVDVRSGYRDTVEVWLGASPICLSF